MNAIGKYSIHKPAMRKVIAFVVTLALILGLAPVMPAYAVSTPAQYAAFLGGPTGNMPNGNVDKPYPKEEFSTPGQLSDFLDMTPGMKLTMYIPCLRVYVPTEDRSLGSLYAGFAPNSTIYYKSVTDPTQPPHEKQYTIDYPNAVPVDQNGPTSITIEDKDPTSGFQLETTLKYNPVYGQELFDELDKIQDSTTTDASIQRDQTILGLYLKGFDTFYPAIAPNMQTLNVEGKLDSQVLDKLPQMLSYLGTDDAVNFKNLNISSADDIPATAAAFWSDPKNFTKRELAALDKLDVGLNLPNPETPNAKKFIDAVKELAPNSFKVATVKTDPVTGNLITDPKTGAPVKENEKTIIADRRAAEEAKKAAEEAKKAAEEAKKAAQKAAEEAKKNQADAEIAKAVKSMKSLAAATAADKIVNVQKGKSVKIPLVVYSKKGFTGQKVAVAWEAPNPKIAAVSVTKKTGTIAKDKKSGTLKTIKLDANAKLTVKAGKKIGWSTVTVKVGNKSFTYLINVVKKKTKVKSFATNKISKKLNKGVATLKKGKTKVIKVSAITPKTATGNVVTYQINKKYKKYLTVDAAGKLTAKKAYKKAIPVKVKVGNKSKTLKVKVTK